MQIAGITFWFYTDHICTLKLKIRFGYSYSQYRLSTYIIIDQLIYYIKS